MLAPSFLDRAMERLRTEFGLEAFARRQRALCHVVTRQQTAYSASVTLGSPSVACARRGHDLNVRPSGCEPDMSSVFLDLIKIGAGGRNRTDTPCGTGF
jgi:hypothetical protein